MYASIQLRFNPELGREAYYYRIKKLYRDINGNIPNMMSAAFGITQGFRRTLLLDGNRAPHVHAEISHDPAVNNPGNMVELRQYSRPSGRAALIYMMLGIKAASFKKIKICRS